MEKKRVGLKKNIKKKKEKKKGRKANNKKRRATLAHQSNRHLSNFHLSSPQWPICPEPKNIVTYSHGTDLWPLY